MLSSLFKSEVNRLDNSRIIQPLILRVPGNALYNLADDAYVSVVSFQRGNSRTNLAGDVVTGSRITDSGIRTMVTLFPYSNLLKVSGLNAAQFSRTFRGTFIPRLQPAPRGAINRMFNKFLYTKQTEYLLKGAYLSW